LRIEIGNNSRRLWEKFPDTKVCFSVFDRAHLRGVTSLPTPTDRCSGRRRPCGKKKQS
jgi:hypothetical protein